MGDGPQVRDELVVGHPDAVIADDQPAPTIFNLACDPNGWRFTLKRLALQGVQHGRIGDWPAWHVAPCASIWAIESLVRPEWIGWWVLSGDLPTDYISSADVQPPQIPRKAIRAIAERWLKQVEAWNAGRDYEGIRIGGGHSHKELAPLLESRAKLLMEWWNDDSFWEQE
jgi:hypothetical protein